MLVVCWFLTLTYFYETVLLALYVLFRELMRTPVLQLTQISQTITYGNQHFQFDHDEKSDKDVESSLSVVNVVDIYFATSVKRSYREKVE